MIADFTNPHGREIEPQLVEELPSIPYKYRIIRKHGTYIVEMRVMDNLNWSPLQDTLYNKPAKYPTLHEAENFICRHRKPEVHYYY